ncbi:MAG: class I SAM-dependent methyltransferase [FCB group bacterium]|nr:class I SAM-dependent methyltransferase [FCB group bacterium]
MKQHFQDIFVAPDTHQLLHYKGIFTNGFWSDGLLKTSSGDVQYTVEDGIPQFVPPSQDPWSNEEQVRAILQEHHIDPDRLIEKNWSSLTNSQEAIDKYGVHAQVIANREGIILELAGGPGGGATPLILKYNPQAKILFNDWGLWILKEWQKLYDSRIPNNNIGFAQFDATRMPLKNNSFDAVSSIEGLSNINNTSQAIKETFRTLKPTGKLFLVDYTFGRNEFQQFPKDVQNDLQKQFPFVGIGYEKFLTDVGFYIEKYQEIFQRPIVAGEGGFADLASQYGVDLHLHYFAIVARK